jgi:hypothetical protein
MIIKAKFYVSSITIHANAGGKNIELRPVSGSEENRVFWEATPSGRFEMFVRAGEAADAFVPGDEILIDFHIREKV